jgi:hypothetical protein
MARFTRLELLPNEHRENLLTTLRHYAAIIENDCGIGHGQERDSFHYVEHTYFLWEHDNCLLRLFWSDEENTKEWFWLTIDCENSDANDLAIKLLTRLKPYLTESRINHSQ